LTGLAQVSGRNAINWEEKFEYDIDYIKKISFLKDFKIVINTVSKVFRKNGVNQNSEISMETFEGTK
ncbi:MAG: sugar transferase, partial [Eubacterium sp.]